MIFFATSALANKNFRIIINSFGSNNTPMYLEPHESLDKLEIPTRDDGAIFEGWYYSLNFDEKFKVKNHNELEYVIINAKYDKCYCFSLRYNVLGCFGKEDTNGINYYIPSGNYKVTFTTFSKAKSGNIMVYDKNNNLVRQIDYLKIGEEKNIIINEDEHVLITEDSVFEFQRVDVDYKYVEFRMD